jgi:nucleoside-diphosphate-sugar epimerase
VLRFFSVYGPGQQANGGSGVVSIFAEAALAGRPLIVQSAGRRDFTDVRDVARGIQRALELPNDGTHRVYNVATGIGTTFAHLAHTLLKLTGSSSTIEERFPELEPPGRDLVADISRARTDLDYEPCIGLRDGLEHYVAWLTRASV